MKRTTKKFLKSVNIGLGIFAYVFFSMMIPAAIAFEMGLSSDLGIFVGLLMLVIFPAIVFLFWHIYRDAVRDVGSENSKLLDQLNNKDKMHE